MNPEHVEIVKQGKEAIDQWRQAHPGDWLDLIDSNLHWADLSGANLSWADLSSANLFWANLSAANLIGADLSMVDLVTNGASWARD